MYSDANESSNVRGGAARFESTHWTVVLEAARQDTASGQVALETLYRAYWRPIYAFLRRNGRSREGAEDLTQDFFARLVEKNWLASITREGAKFRSVLLTMLKHFLAHAREHEQALKRGAGKPQVSLDALAISSAEVPDLKCATPEREFERRWALDLLERSLARLRQEYVRLEKADLFEELKVFLSGTSRPVPHSEIAARHDISITAVGVAIHRLRRRYGEMLREEIVRTVTDPNEVDTEIRQLIGVLAE